MKLFVDDLRDPPDASWTVARTSAEAIRLLDGDEPVETLSLDHDLGGDDTTRPLVLWLCETGAWPAVVYVHSANPVGVEWLVGMVERYGSGVADRRGYGRA
ncbi:cyclic-phosphate processing receiver domain-containing protein [Tsukamurella soli]|uniref:Cyclic-phosphate processing Receiver domain-containing protein n=1 Tax=Tsukamurella soli TaxID=644556 RepID=A0ABP8JRU8_9ACTN